MNIILKVAKHLFSGTLIKVVKQYPVKKKFESWELLNKGKIEFLIKKNNDGSRLKLYKDSLLSWGIYFDKFESKELAFVKSFLHKGDIFLDIGANIGLFSINASKKVGERGAIIAFEPTQKTYERLTGNIKLNNFTNIFPLKLALSDTVGISDIYSSIGANDALNSFGVPTEGNDYVKESVETTTIDEYCIHNKMVENVKLIKIDVEGWELPVIRGGLNLLSKKNNIVLVIEFTDPAARSAGFSCQELYKTLTSIGYKLYNIDDDFSEAPMKENYIYENLIACKDKNILKGGLKI